MREFSHEELAHLLSEKVKQLQNEKEESEKLVDNLQNKIFQIEIVTKKLRIAEKNLEDQRDRLLVEVKQKTKELLKKEKLSAVGELSARIAHDMRNPLSIIKNTCEIIKMDQKNATSKDVERWERLDRAIQRMTHQVEDVLDYVRDAPLAKKKNKISLVIKNAIERVAIPGNIRIVPPANDVVLPCDAERLEAVFVNLIMNAVQAIGNKKGEIFVNLTYDSDIVLVKIKDNGPGIPKKLIPKIFDPLFTTRQIGTGLGLPSCRNVVEKHRGSIDVESTVGKGTTFFIRLPLKTEWDNLAQISQKERLTDFITSIRS